MKKAWYVYSLRLLILSWEIMDFLHRPRNTVRVNNPTDPADEEVIEDDSEERR